MRIGDKEYRIKTGLTIFLIITTITAIVLAYRGFDRDTLTSLKQIRPVYGLLTAILVIVYWCLNGLRFQILVKGLKENVSFWVSTKAFIANLFLGAVTPFQTGGGPLQIYILSRMTNLYMYISYTPCSIFAGCPLIDSRKYDHSSSVFYGGLTKSSMT